MQKIADYDIEIHGVDMPSYFQGAGIALTEYTDIATGIGDSEQQAAKDALEQLAQRDWDIDGCAALLAEIEEFSDVNEIGDIDEDCDEYPQVYVSIRVR